MENYNCREELKNKKQLFGSDIICPSYVIGVSLTSHGLLQLVLIGARGDAMVRVHHNLFDKSVSIVSIVVINEPITNDGIYELVREQLPCITTVWQ